jgi:hypothetical protein
MSIFDNIGRAIAEQIVSKPKPFISAGAAPVQAPAALPPRQSTAMQIAQSQQSQQFQMQPPVSAPASPAARQGPLSPVALAILQSFAQAGTPQFQNAPTPYQQPATLRERYRPDFAYSK